MEKELATHSSTPAWKIPWTAEAGRLQSMGSLRVRHDRETSLSPSLSCIGAGNGNPLQCSCLENPRDGGAYGVAQSGTRLQRLSSSSSKVARQRKGTTSQELGDCGWKHTHPHGANPTSLTSGCAPALPQLAHRLCFVCVSPTPGTHRRHRPGPAQVGSCAPQWVAASGLPPDSSSSAPEDRRAIASLDSPGRRSGDGEQETGVQELGKRCRGARSGKLQTLGLSPSGADGGDLGDLGRCPPSSPEVSSAPREELEDSGASGKPSPAKCRLREGGESGTEWSPWSPAQSTAQTQLKVHPNGDRS